MFFFILTNDGISLGPLYIWSSCPATKTKCLSWQRPRFHRVQFQPWMAQTLLNKNPSHIWVDSLPSIHGWCNTLVLRHLLPHHQISIFVPILHVTQISVSDHLLSRAQTRFCATLCTMILVKINQLITRKAQTSYFNLRIMSNTSKTEPWFSIFAGATLPAGNFGVLKSFAPCQILNSPAALRPNVPMSSEDVQCSPILPWESSPYHHRIALWHISFQKQFPRPNLHVILMCPPHRPLPPDPKIIFISLALQPSA